MLQLHYQHTTVTTRQSCCVFNTHACTSGASVVCSCVVVCCVFLCVGCVCLVNRSGGLNPKYDLIAPGLQRQTSRQFLRTRRGVNNSKSFLPFRLRKSSLRLYERAQAVGLSRVCIASPNSPFSRICTPSFWVPHLVQPHKGRDSCATLTRHGG